MSDERNSLMGKLTQLECRATEIGDRMQRDAMLLAEVHQEVASLLGRIWSLPAPVVVAAVPPKRPQVLRMVQVSELISLSRSSVWRMVKEGRFPAPRRLSARSVGCLESDIDHWLTARADESQPHESDRPGRSGPRGRGRWAT